MLDYQDIKASFVQAGKDYFGRKPFRVCGSCSLCCKLLKVEALDKPAGEWCKHCVPGEGCGIYADRPEGCKFWMCEWLVNRDLRDEWFPAKSKIVIDRTMNEHGKRMIRFVVDPGYPNRWREEPWYHVIKSVAKNGMGIWQTVIEVGDRNWIVFPNKEVEVKPGPGMSVRVAEEAWEYIPCESQEHLMKLKEGMDQLAAWSNSLSDVERAIGLAELEAMKENAK